MFDTVGCELLDLVIVPGACLWGTGLATTGTKRILTTAEGVEAGALGAIGKHLRASIRLTRCLEPEEGINALVAGIGSGDDSDTSATDVAPVRTVLTHRLLTVAASVNDEMRGVTSTVLEIVLQHQSVVHLIV